jgi:hypothetical protein
MDTFLNTLAMLLVLVLLALPSLVGHARELRIDRQLRDAERARSKRAGTPVGVPARPERGYGRAA